MSADMLRSLDLVRRAAGEPSGRGDIVRELSPDGSECRIAFSRCTAAEIEDVIREETSSADSVGYTLEWKVYGHDVPTNLGSCLLAAGFEPDALESLLVLPLNEAALAAFEAAPVQVRRVHGAEGLSDVAEIAREIGRRNVENERRQLALVLRDTPAELSVHVAYVDGEPVACGRIYFKENSDVAELAGGRTKTTHRNRGLFTDLVASRLREALERGCTQVFVDALPTSEPIFTKKGFQFVTHTQPFVYEPPSTEWRIRS